MHRNAWIPFGSGVHKCIGLYFGGMQVKAAMHQLLLATAGACRRDYEMPIDWSRCPAPRTGCRSGSNGSDGRFVAGAFAG